MDQAPLFHESFMDAIRDSIRAAGGSKAVGAKLWPELKADQAGKKVSNCLDESRPERFTPDQLLYILKLSREAGCHSILVWMCQEAGYSSPQPLEPESELAGLIRESNAISAELVARQARIERRLKSLKVA